MGRGKGWVRACDSSSAARKAARGGKYLRTAAQLKQKEELVALCVLLYVPTGQALHVKISLLEKSTVAIMPFPVLVESDDQEIVRELEVVVQEPSRVPLTEASVGELALGPLNKYR